jgi:DNA-binding transcriptional ArsR family regulator
MPGPEPDPGIALGRDEAEVYARWFRAVADPTRIIILSYLARQPEPVAVGAIAGNLRIGQSSVSRHLRILHEVGFVTRARSRASRLYTVNRNCITRFPEAAEVIMGLPAELRAAR